MVTAEWRLEHLEEKQMYVVAKSSAKSRARELVCRVLLSEPLNSLFRVWIRTFAAHLNSSAHFDLLILRFCHLCTKITLEKLWSEDNELR